jgi:hypothetical protein
MSTNAGRSPSGRCSKVVLGFFGALFLITLLSVPVTTRTSQIRQDKSSNLVVRTTYPKNSRMFLFTYLSAKGRSDGKAAVHLRSTLWIATVAIVAILGIVDYLVVCRLLRRPLIR